MVTTWATSAAFDGRTMAPGGGPTPVEQRPCLVVAGVAGGDHPAVEGGRSRGRSRVVASEENFGMSDSTLDDARLPPATLWLPCDSRITPRWEAAYRGGP